MAVQVAKHLGASRVIGAGAIHSGWRPSPNSGPKPLFHIDETSCAADNLGDLAGDFARAIRLADVEAAWGDTGSAQRIVIAP
jgi:hypothetical protein